MKLKEEKRIKKKSKVKGLPRKKSHTTQKNNKQDILEQRYKDLYDGIPDLLRSVDKNGKLTQCNKRYAKTLGYTQEEAIGMSLFEHTAERSMNDMKNEFEEWQKTGKITNNFEIWCKRKDGTIFPTLLNATNLYDANQKVVGRTVALRDMTDTYEIRQAVEQEKMKRLSAIGELSGRIMHDLRNPLSIIQNSVHLILLHNSNLDEYSKQKFTVMDRAVKRIIQQIGEVLNYATQPPLRLDSTSIYNIINSVLERIPTVSTVTIETPKDDFSIVCDEEKIENVLVNLVTNAMQAMNNNGNISIQVTEKNNTIILEVQDNGPGISDEVLAKIFEPLFTTKPTGTGLGLSICKNIIERHGGTIEVKSRLGIGTTFVITIPKSDVVK